MEENSKTKVSSKEVRAPREKNSSPVVETYRGEEGGTLLELIQHKSGRSRNSSKQLLSSRRITVDGFVESHALRLLKADSLVKVHQASPPKAFEHPLITILWEDNDYIVVHKSSGIYTVNTTHKDKENTALWIVSRHVKEADPQAKVFMVNRLDKETAGVVVLAKSQEAKEKMVGEWSRLVREQKFVLVAQGDSPESPSVLTAKSGKEEKQGQKQNLQPRRLSRCEVKLLKSSKNKGMHVLEAKMGGERIFSLRKLMGDNGLVILGDGRYQSPFKMKGQIALVQTALEFLHPITQEVKRFTLPFPSHFFAYLKEDKEEPSDTNIQRKRK